MQTELGLTDWFGRRAVPAIAALIILANLFMVGFLIHTEREQDAQSATMTKSFLTSQLLQTQNNLSITLKDYAAWGEAYRHLHPQVDREWALDGENLSSSLFSGLGIEFAFVIGPDGHTSFALERGNYSANTIETLFGSDVKHLIDRARSVPTDTSEPALGFALNGEMAVLLAASAISTGNDPDIKPVDGPSSVLVFGKSFDRARLDRLSQTSFTPGLRVERTNAVSEAESTIRLQPAGNNSPQLALVWEPITPGSQLLTTMLPSLIAAAVALGLLTIFILRHAVLSARAIDAANRLLEQARKQAEYSALHDPLTGLPNRSGVLVSMNRMLREPGAEIAVIYIDIDRFKPINDAFGHHTGDAVLLELSRRLTDLVPNAAVSGRMGSDEFVLVLEKCSEAAIRATCDAILQEVRRPIALEVGNVHVGCSIGVAMCRQGDAADADYLLRAADIATHRSKSKGGDGYTFFSREIEDIATDRVFLEERIRAGFAAGEFEMFYQPRHDLRTMQRSSFEALLRWRHESFSHIPTLTIIKIAEETGLIHEIGRWALLSACQAAALFENEGVSVNISPVQFRAGNVVEDVLFALKRSGIAPHRLELEITENVLLDDSAITRERLDELKKLGVKLSIDDFGTGYSALSYLRRYPFDRLKIDRQFIADIDKSASARAIVRAVVGLAHALGMTVTAEGVETEEHLHFLREEGCDEVQGYLVSLPLPLSAFVPRPREALLTGAGCRSGSIA